jgi:hypothetical protein
MSQITNEFLQHVAGTIEALLLEEQEGIDFAYRKIGTGIKVSIGLNFDPSADGIVVSYDLNYAIEPRPEPPEKRTIKKKETIDVNQLDFLDDLKTGRVVVEFDGQDILQQ